MIYRNLKGSSFWTGYGLGSALTSMYFIPCIHTLSGVLIKFAHWNVGLVGKERCNLHWWASKSAVEADRREEEEKMGWLPVLARMFFVSGISTKKRYPPIISFAKCPQFIFLGKMGGRNGRGLPRLSCWVSKARKEGQRAAREVGEGYWGHRVVISLINPVSGPLSSRSVCYIFIHIHYLIFFLLGRRPRTCPFILGQAIFSIISGNGSPNCGS